MMYPQKVNSCTTPITTFKHHPPQKLQRSYWLYSNTKPLNNEMFRSGESRTLLKMTLAVYALNRSFCNLKLGTS